MDEIGATYGSGTTGASNTRSVSVPSGGTCADGVITYAGGEKLAHNGDYMIYSTPTAVYIGVGETPGVSSAFYAGQTFEGISSVPGSPADYTLSISVPLIPTILDNGIPDSNDGYVARLLGDTESLLFSNEDGTSGVLSQFSGITLLFNGCLLYTSPSPRDS